MHTIQLLDSSCVVICQVEVFLVALVIGKHNGPSDIGVVQSEAVTELVNCHPKEVSACATTNDVIFIVIKVYVTRRI